MLAMKLRPGHGHPAADDFNESRSRQEPAIFEVLTAEPDAPANAAAVSRVFVAVAASAAGASALTAAVSAHWRAFAEGADDPVPAWSGVSGVH